MGRLNKRRRFGLTGVLALGAIYLVTPGAQAKQPELRADLDGRPISPDKASLYFCHDFDFQWIHCFSTPDALEAAMPLAASTSSQVAVVAAFGPSDYVTVYSSPTYSGSFAHLSQNYDALATIGWNDMISSYRARNNRTGAFYEHWFAGGSKKTFCCNQNVPSLPSGIDNTFSSVYRTS
jgi:hypothetical protein